MARRMAWLEPACVTVAVWFALTALSASEGGIGLSWDAINHHIYLGWTAGSHRLDQDFLAANFQSLQFPYLYWPAYLLASHGAGPVLAAAVLSALHALSAPALWLIARALLPGDALQATTLRVMAVMLGYLSPVVLALSDNTANDLLAATPLVWAVAFGVLGLAPHLTDRARWMWVAGAGLLAGVATAFKLSNGPLVVALPVLWAIGAGPFTARAARIVLGGMSLLAGFAATYGEWGWQLWLRYGNPLYPFYDGLFEPLRRLVGWAP